MGENETKALEILRRELTGNTVSLYELDEVLTRLGCPSELDWINDECAWDDIFSELVKSCDTLEEARETLKRYKTDITPYDGCYLVTEYCVLPEIYDEDGEIVESGDIEEITEMKIGVEDEEWNVVKTFDNLKEADDFVRNDERELTLAY